MWRLNQELLPDPGKPIASTTVPLEGRGDSVGGGVVAGLAAARPRGAALSFGEGCIGATASLPATADSGGGAPLRPRPRPPLPRRRRRLFTSPLPASRGCLACGSAGGASPADSGCSAAAIEWLTSADRLLVGWLGIVKCRLQRCLRGLSSRLLRLLLAALQALAHPFAHLWLVTHPEPCGQRMPSQANQARQPHRLP